jgi:hypothetical protein
VLAAAADAARPGILRKFGGVANDWPDSHCPRSYSLSAAMLTRRILILGAACALTAVRTPAPAADASALAFVTAIYNGYKGNDSPGHALDSEPVIRRYFEPSLAALMIKDQKAAARRGEVGTLDFDPFVNAQEWEISEFDIAVSETAPGKASATVKFTNLGKPTIVSLDLVAIKNGWRIGDIIWQIDGKSQTLRGLYAH